MGVLHDPEYSVTLNPNSTLGVCFNKSMTLYSGLWQENSLATTVPLFCLQFGIILGLNRLFLLLSEPLHLPRIVLDVFAGILIGPSFLGRSELAFQAIIPYKSVLTLETMASLALVYYMFLIGLEFDLESVKRCNKKAIAVTFFSIIFTVPAGCGLYYLLVSDLGRQDLPPTLKYNHFRGAILWGVTLSCTEFPEIAKILTDLKLLHSENGQLALTSALTNDLHSWISLLITVALLHDGAAESVFSTIVFSLVCFFVIHPIARWIFKEIGSQDREFLEAQVIFLLHLVLVFGFLTDGLGAHSITGAYILGTITPRGVIKDAVQDKVLDFVSQFMMPLFFAVIGIRVNVDDFFLDIHWTTVVLVILLAFSAKIICTLLVCFLYRMPFLEGLSIGLLMNTKGMVSTIILVSARDRLVLTNQTFGVMLIACWLMTIPVRPVLAATNKLSPDIGHSQFRTMQGARPDTPLRVLACVHTQRDANVIINLLKASFPTIRSPIQVTAVELTKMKNRPAPSLIIKDSHKSTNKQHSNKFFGCLKNENNKKEDILASFDNLTQAIFADKLRIVSTYATMHKDIFHLARHRAATLILTTLYKQPTFDGLGLGAATARAANIVNKETSDKDKTRKVLENLAKETPCCLAIFIDRGFRQKQAKELRLAMFYVGGPDDREALSYAWRMSRNPDVQLTVLRLVWENPNDEFDDTDDEYLRYFKFETRNTNSVGYLEKAVKDEKETVALLNKMGRKGFDLHIAGRGNGRKMSLAQTRDPVLEVPALGPLGDALADLESAAETSILILQTQAADAPEMAKPIGYAYFGGHGDLMVRGGHMTWRATDS